mmetsp:Transcript_3627/g.6345  ORF Transcript_3627/g.6345 Transcript_3627/m.6345 type:complete len:92 (+) Transcript_3627:523-798(+)
MQIPIDVSVRQKRQNRDAHSTTRKLREELRELVNVRQYDDLASGPVVFCEGLMYQIAVVYACDPFDYFVQRFSRIRTLPLTVVLDLRSELW